MRGRRAAGVAATGAPIALGAIAAGLQMTEIERLLTGGIEGSIVGLEVFHDLGSRAAVTTRLGRHSKCRFDHIDGPPDIVADISVGALAAKVPCSRGLSIHGQGFVRSIGCPRCPRGVAEVWRFVRDVRLCSAACPSCGATLQATGMDLEDGMPLEALDPRKGSQTLRELGVREGELLVVEADGGRRFFEHRTEPVPAAAEWTAGAPRTIVVVGLGNIGSNLVDTLVRTQSALIERLILIDPDSYDRGNLTRQRIDAADVGHPKALVQARHVLRRRPFLSVVAYVSRVEELPAGILRGTVVAGCVDSRAARQSLAELAWRMGAPLVDAAVDAGVPAVRVAGYMPGPRNACLECSFLDEDYAALEQRIACTS